MSLVDTTFHSFQTLSLSIRCLNSKEPAYNAGDAGSIPGSQRSPGEENSTPLQYSCLKNFMDRGDWQAMVHWIAKNQI